MSRRPHQVTADELLAFALGGLPPAEEAEVRAAVEADPALYAQWQETLEALGPLLADLDLRAGPPAGAEERLLARLAQDAPGAAAPALPAPSGAPRRWAWAALGLAAALALGLVFSPWRTPTPSNPLERYAAQPGAVSRTVKRGGAALAVLVRLPDGRVFVRAQRAPAAGQVYQLWQLPAGRGGRPVSLGVLRGQDLLTGPLPGAVTLALSAEPPGGSPQPTSEPLFAETL